MNDFDQKQNRNITEENTNSPSKENHHNENIQVEQVPTKNLSSSIIVSDVSNTSAPTSDSEVSGPKLNSDNKLNLVSTSTYGNANIPKEEKCEKSNLAIKNEKLEAKNCNTTLEKSNSKFSNNDSYHNSSLHSQQLQQREIPITANAVQKARNMHDLHHKFMDELHYMMFEFRKLEKQLLSGGNGNFSENQGSRERREKLRSFIIHLEDTMKQISNGCKLEIANNLNEGVPLEDEESKIKNARRLEAHIVTNLLPVKERLMKQLAAQGKTDSLKRPRKPETRSLNNNSTNIEALSQTNQQIEQNENLIGRRFQTGQGSSLTRKLHGAALGVPAGFVPCPITNVKPSEESSQNPKKHIFFGGVAPGSDMDAKMTSVSTASAAFQSRSHQPMVSNETGSLLTSSTVVTTATVQAESEVKTNEIHPSTIESNYEEVSTQKASIMQHVERHHEAKAIQEAMTLSTNAPTTSTQTPPISQPNQNATVAAAAINPTHNNIPEANQPPMQQAISEKSSLKEKAVVSNQPATAALAALTVQKDLETSTKLGAVIFQEAEDTSYDIVTLPVGENKSKENDEKLNKRLLRKRKRRRKRRRVHGGIPGTGNGRSSCHENSYKNMGSSNRRDGSASPRAVEYTCALCNETYMSRCDYNPWWALTQEDCRRCNKLQVPRIDISAPANIIDYHPALLAHADDGNNVNTPIDNNEHVQPDHSNAQHHSRHVNGNVELFDNDSYSSYEDDSTHSGSYASDSDQSEDFGVNYKGPTLNVDEAKRLLILIQHAAKCPGRHKNQQQREICQSTKFLMLHTRDCSGTLPSGESCPFPWCRKVKHLLAHLISCKHQTSCPICSLTTSSSNYQHLTTRNTTKKKVTENKSLVTSSAGNPHPPTEFVKNSTDIETTAKYAQPVNNSVSQHPPIPSAPVEPVGVNQNDEKQPQIASNEPIDEGTKGYEAALSPKLASSLNECVDYTVKSSSDDVLPQMELDPNSHLNASTDAMENSLSISNDENLIPPMSNASELSNESCTDKSNIETSSEIIQPEHSNELCSSNERNENITSINQSSIESNDIVIMKDEPNISLDTLATAEVGEEISFKDQVQSGVLTPIKLESPKSESASNIQTNEIIGEEKLQSPIQT